MSDLNAPPLNPVPWVVWLLALPMIAMEVVVQAGANGLAGGSAGFGWRVQAQQTFGFAPDYLRQMLSAWQFPLEGIYRLFSYAFVHLDLPHTVFVVVILLALGKFVGEVYAWWAVLVTFLAATAMGALVYTALPLTHAGLLGGYPGNYGLIGAYTFLLWVRLAGQGSLRAFQLIGFFMVFQIAIAAIGIAMYGPLQGTTWQFVADLTGFVTGFALAFVVSPGGWARVLAKLRAT
jgi:membrane associated rhomboid family serine protease